MNYDPAELAALLSEPWSNGACRGYVIMAMENCGFAGDDIRRIMAELHELFDFVSLEEAEAHYQKSLFLLRDIVSQGGVRQEGSIV